MNYKTYKFPSVYKQVIGENFLDTVKMNGNEYLVGEKVMRNGSHLWDTNSLIKYTPLFLKYLKDVKGEDISNIVLSVPTATFANAVKQDKSGKTDTYFNKMTIKIKDMLSDEVKDVKFLPQGVSALYYYKSLGEIKTGDKVLTIDGGFNTLNLAITEVGENSLNLLFDESEFDKGIRTLLIDKFLPLLQKEIAEDIPKDYHYLKKVFLSGEIGIGLNSISVKPYVEIATKVYLDELMEFVTQTVKRSSDESYNVINVVGGLSYYIQNKIKSSKKVIIPEKNGEFMTAIGMATKHPKHLAVDLGFGDVKVAKKS